MHSSAADPQIFNRVRFQRMACGDLGSFYELADEYFEEVHTRLRQWPAMLEARENRRLCEEFHRCKGGAAMFGFERLFTMLGEWETDSGIEKGGVSLERFASELAAVESAVSLARAELTDA